MVTFMVAFENFDEHPRQLYMGVPPPGFVPRLKLIRSLHRRFVPKLNSKGQLISQFSFKISLLAHQKTIILIISSTDSIWIVNLSSTEFDLSTRKIKF